MSQAAKTRVHELDGPPRSEQDRANMEKFTQVTSSPEFSTLVEEMTQVVSGYLLQKNDPFTERVNAECHGSVAIQVRHQLMMCVLSRVAAASICTMAGMSKYPRKALEERESIYAKNVHLQIEAMTETMSLGSAEPRTLN